jgi:FAD/FMN-containing dehydrogenase
LSPDDLSKIEINSGANAPETVPEAVSAIGSRPAVALPWDHLERTEGFGMTQSGLSFVYRPSTVEGIREVFELARRTGRFVALRGGGRSYGDAAVAGENICLDLTRMNRILEWDPVRGIAMVEPGVTIGQLWQYTIGDGWWPPVVTGTMFITIGGGAGMNVHGKNNFAVGPIGDHILNFDLLLPNGEIRHCSRVENSDLFFAAIGGFGMLGCFVRITLQMKRIYSGMVAVEGYPARNMAELIEQFERQYPTADYLVAWIDCFARGKSLGRALVHEAHYLHAGDDPNTAQTLRVEYQTLPDTMMGVIPKSIMWMFMLPFACPLGMRLTNWAKFHLSARLEPGKIHRQSHGAFNFLLDYVPNWKLAYKYAPKLKLMREPGGFIQYQSFIPAATACECLEAEIRLCQQRGLVPWLAVFKRHRKDAFLMTHAVDGYSMALDFPVSARNRKRLWELAAELNRIVLEAGGRFYFAKDSTLEPESAETYLGAETLDKFFALKRECDPESLLQTDLANRIFGDRLRDERPAAQQ